MTEAFLHFVWSQQLFNADNLFAVSGETIRVVKTGWHNHDAGPDFFQAQIQIDNTLWAGHVEIHIRSSDWNRHGHTADPLYRNCILHVVWEHDVSVCGCDGQPLITLELKGRMDERILHNYEQLMEQRQELPCSSYLPAVDTRLKRMWLERMAIERLEHRTTTIELELSANAGHWEVTFFHKLARNFGFLVNADPMERLARSIPYSLLVRTRGNLLTLEALLFGQAGFLSEDLRDDHMVLLRDEYRYQSQLHKLSPLVNPGWKWMRLRPANFPAVRLAQLASLIHHVSPLFHRISAVQNWQEILALFSFDVSLYWQHHVQPGIVAGRPVFRMGEDSIRLIVINTLVPFMFARGRQTGDYALCEKALDIWDSLGPESNRIIRMWERHAYVAHNATASQALLHLYHHYCSVKKCLHCGIGNQLIVPT